MDDAYLALGLIAAASQRCFESSGLQLINFPPALLSAHLEIRALLGEPIASRLDGYVTGTVITFFPQLMAQLAQTHLPLQPGMSYQPAVR